LKLPKNVYNIILKFKLFNGKELKPVIAPQKILELKIKVIFVYQ